MLCFINIVFFFCTDGVKPDEHLECHNVIDMRSVMRTEPFVNLGNLYVECIVLIWVHCFSQKAL